VQRAEGLWTVKVGITVLSGIAFWNAFFIARRQTKQGSPRMVGSREERWGPLEKLAGDSQREALACERPMNVVRKENKTTDMAT